MEKNYSLTLGWLYPDLMSTYGDRGNVLVLQKKCQWKGITFNVLQINQRTAPEEIEKVDLIFGGGSQDIQQEIVMRDLMGKKGEAIKNLIEKDIPALFVCGSPQIMGKYYEPAVGKRIEGLGIFDMYTVNPGPDKQRCIGNIVAETTIGGAKNTIVGFENHGGRTYLGASVKPFATVLHGYGNNGEDKTEGVIYRNAIGCYLHGPLLPKNPLVADYLLQKAYYVKYKEVLSMHQEPDVLAEKAKEGIIQLCQKK